MNLKKIVSLSFLGFLMAAPFLYADRGPRSTDVTIASSEKNLFGPTNTKEKDGEDSFGVRNSF